MRADPALVTALQAGEPAALDRLYRDHAAAVLGWVIRLGGPWIDAEDVAHEVFVTAFGLARGFRGESTVSTWLFGVTRRVVANARRKVAVRRFFGLYEEGDVAAAGPRADDALADHARRRAVVRALDHLTLEHREVIVLCELEERSTAEAAELLGVPAGTVYSRLFHARHRFARALALEGVTAEGGRAGERGSAAEAGDNVVPLRRPS